AVTGLSIVGLGLAGISSLYYFYHDPSMIIGFGFGASLVSLFARVGGGIFTKAADVGADLVGKIEKGIPEDDPRNPAVIADNVGDNVGDDAGMGADLFESYIVTILAAMLLGVALGINSVVFPLALSAVGIIASIIGVFFIFARKGKNIWASLTQGILVSALLSIIGFYIVSQYFMSSMSLFYAGVVGIVATVLILYVTGHYTSRDKKSVYEIAKSSETGAATNIIFGLALGMRSVFIPMLIMVAAIFLSFMFAGVYGIAIAAVGLLSLTGIIMSIDAYGPISDNAGGIAEMSHMPKNVRQVTDALDAVGNTTKATTKGIAIASAAISALALFAAFAQSTGLQSIDLMKVKVLIGLLIGGAIPFLFSSFLMRAVGNASYSVVKEVRRQFKEIKGLMQGKAKPDYAQCVDICTKSALKEMAKPALLAIASPVVVGFLLGAEALAGLLAGSIVSGFLLAIMFCTGGAAWDNAKKFIEIGNFGGKGSDAHKAAVVGDTVGDPAKDTAGPSLNALIKVLNTLSILIGVMLVV
ncbi:MAG: sodium-translocating pyrophosphatase, partial [Candidatus Aenigmatarchaeota archaeon]